jgi:hypothetical protein
MSKFTIEFNVANREFLLEALKRLDLSFSETQNRIYLANDLTIDLGTKQVEARGWTQDRVEYQMNSIKRKYSEVVLEEVAKRNKWLLKKKQEQRQFILRRY